MKKLRTAFTLIELLVVIAIISILASMMFPSFSRVRESARRASCASNLKQLGLGFMQYTQDNDERLPGAWNGGGGINQIGGWVQYSVFGSGSTSALFDPAQGSVYSYVKNVQVFVCPSDSEGRVSGNSYAMNSCSLTSSGIPGFVAGKALAAFEDSSQWMVLSEENSSTTSTDDGYQLLISNHFSDRHNGTSNVLLLDGHVKSYQPGQIESNGIQTGGVPGGACP